MEKFRYLPREKLNNIPKAPGVYALASPKVILYIGKAANIRDRAKNHFQQPNYRDNLFISQVTKVGYIETQSEIDALLLESQLIKSRQPKYNVMWKDDKQYFYVAITKETLPRVFLTHQPVARAGSVPALGKQKEQGQTLLLLTQYVGPFVDGKAIKQVLRLLRGVFPYYTARKHPILPCPYCHIGLCPGPPPRPEGAGEARSQSERQAFAKEYKQNTKNLVSVLRGRRVSVLKNLKKSMAQASKEQDFEKAAILRDQVFSLENIASHASLGSPSYTNLGEPKEKRLPRPWSQYKRIEAYDISNIQGKQATGSMVTFLKGKPAKEWYRKFKIHITGKSNDFAMMEELISRRLRHLEWSYPDLMLIDGGKGQLSSALKAISNLVKLSYPQLSLTKLQHIKVAALAKRNNELFLPEKRKPLLLKDLPQGVSNLLLHIRDEAHRFAITYHRKLRKVDALESS